VVAGFELVNISRRELGEHSGTNRVNEKGTKKRNEKGGAQRGRIYFSNSYFSN
jgi:hypothetical protein